MKKFVTIMIVICILLSSIAVSANMDYTISIALCYNGDVYSVDYVFDVLEETNISSVTVSDQNCFYDWNYVKSEARLYLSLASANVIPKLETIASVTSDKEVSLTLVSVKVNGNITDKAYAYHTSIDMEYVAPGIDTPGHTGGERCANCNIILTEPEIVPANGPRISAVLSDGGTLTVSGALSDNTEAEGTTFIAVYDKSKRMIGLKDASSLNQSYFRTEIENMREAHTVKVLRWNISNLIPLYNAVECTIK